jgi:hypothetical protein
VTKSHQPGRLKSILLLALGFGILLSLLVPHAVGHLPLSLLCLTLVPLFLFAALQTLPSPLLPDHPVASLTAPQAARNTLFQIPPPIALA